MMIMSSETEMTEKEVAADEIKYGHFFGHYPLSIFGTCEVPELLLSPSSGKNRIGVGPVRWRHIPK
jgi:hypothetical protein